MVNQGSFYLYGNQTKDRLATSPGSIQHFGLGQVGNQLGIMFLMWKPGSR